MGNLLAVGVDRIGGDGDFGRAQIAVGLSRGRIAPCPDAAAVEQQFVQIDLELPNARFKVAVLVAEPPDCRLVLLADSLQAIWAFRARAAM